MPDTVEKAYAKLNISLDVTDRRPDGYHNMIMVMQTVSVCDELSITLNSEGRVQAQSGLRYIPGDERNLAVKAAMVFLNAAGIKDKGVDIALSKNIPVGAGMAGGSADAAAVLRALNRLFDAPFSPEQLEKLGEKVGSDVPFCVCGGTSLASGRGEILSPLPDMPDCLYVICKPGFSISTPELFKKLDEVHLHRHPDTAGIISALEQKDLREICRRMYNVFEDVDDRRLRTVSEIKSVMLDHGAYSALMTGTGSAVFGVFTQQAAAENAVEALRCEHSFCCIAENVSRI